jgi:hypothetical protein
MWNCSWTNGQAYQGWCHTVNYKEMKLQVHFVQNFREENQAKLGFTHHSEDARRTTLNHTVFLCTCKDRKLKAAHIIIITTTTTTTIIMKFLL